MSANTSPPARFQYSLKTLLVLMTVVAIALGLMATALGTFVQATFMWTLISIAPSVLVVAAIYGRGDLQAFAIGALVPMAPVVISGASLGWFTSSIFEAVAVCLAALVASGVCGTAAAITRRWLRRHDAEHLPFIDKFS